ncbi:glycosyltransferase [Pseudoalteromonas fuliginea]|uniref:Glycosyltransferase n=1 Tax=Pseudoalteromonas fuliginea TaxID=1872678 RepID=A0AB73BIG6_9GAMM|nr:glycosyltransferase family 2 protein [Pseudoalteromonas fuliginea]KAA1162029.1 glycosyltransferase [Pseudoalteromonas fuliginea]
MINTTVIIPTKNRLDMLCRAVRSVSEQTVLPAAVIIIDDGSLEPVDLSSFESMKNLNITIVRNNSSVGGARSRNIGIYQANSKFVSFLDDDDAWEPNYLKEVSATLLEGEELAVYTSKSFVLSNDLGKVFKESIAVDTISYNKLLNGNFVGTTSCVTVKKSSLVCIGCFDESLPALQDYECWLRLSFNGVIFKPASEAKVFYTINVNSTQISGNYDNHIQAKALISKKYITPLERHQYKKLEATLCFFIAKAVHRRHYLSSLSYTLKALIKGRNAKLIILFIPYKALNLIGVYSS